MFNSKLFLAEFIGTFALVFIGAGAGASNAGLVGVALAHGIILAALYYTFGHISGMQVNPAVTFALALQGALKWSEAVFYWLAQFVGAISAAGLLHLIASTLGGSINASATVGVLTNDYPVLAMLVEVVLTFLLVSVYLQVTVAGKGSSLAGFAIGMTLTAAFLVGGPLTGASLNPARTLGPAIYTAPSLANPYTYVIYLFGPLIGATLAVFLSNFLNKPDEEEVEEVQVSVKKVVVRKMTAKAKK